MVKLIRPHCIADPRVVADRLLLRYGSLGAALAARPSGRQDILASEPGVQRLITLLRQTLIQATRPGVLDLTDLTTAGKLDAYLMASQAFEAIEIVRVLFLNARNRLICDEVVMRGSVDQAAVYVRDIIHRALDLGACALILVHNHPGGSSEPGRADIAVTKSLATAAHALGIKLHDHLIVAASGITSLRALGFI